MPISFACPTCRQTLQVSDAAAGRAGKCPHCKGAIVVPSSSVPVAAFSAAPQAPAAYAAPAAVPAGYPSVARRQGLVARVDELLKKHSPWSYVAAGGGALAVLLLFFLVVIWLFSGSDELTKATRYFPDKSNVLVSVNMSDMLSSRLYQDLKKEVPEIAQFEKDASGPGKLGVADTSSVFVALNMEKAQEEGGIGVVFYKRSGIIVYDAKEYPRNSKVGKYTIYEGNNQTVCNPEGSLEVGGIGPSPALLRSVLQRERAAELGPGILAMQKEVNRSRTITAAISWKDTSANFKQGVGAMAAQTGAAFPIDAVEGLAAEVQFGSADLTIEGRLLCKDAKSAEDIKKAAEGMIALVKLMASKDVPKEVMDILSSIKWDQSGSLVRFGMKITKDQIVQVVRAGQMGGRPRR